MFCLWSADIPLYKLNNKHIINLFYHIGHSLPSETTRKKIVLQLSADVLQRIRNAVHDKQMFLDVDKRTLFGMHYLNILVGSVETSNVSYLCNGEPLPCAPNSNSISHTVDDAVNTRTAGVAISVQRPAAVILTASLKTRFH